MADKVRLILDCVSSRKHTVRTIALMEAFDSELVARAQTCGIEILSLKDLVVRPNLQTSCHLQLSPIQDLSLSTDVNFTFKHRVTGSQFCSFFNTCFIKSKIISEIMIGMRPTFSLMSLSIKF